MHRAQTHPKIHNVCKCLVMMPRLVEVLVSVSSCLGIRILFLYPHFGFGLHFVAIVCYSNNITTLTMTMIMTIAFCKITLHVFFTYSLSFSVQLYHFCALPFGMPTRCTRLSSIFYQWTHLLDTNKIVKSTSMLIGNSSWILFHIHTLSCDAATCALIFSFHPDDSSRKITELYGYINVCSYSHRCNSIPKPFKSNGWVKDWQTASFTIDITSIGVNIHIEFDRIGRRNNQSIHMNQNGCVRFLFIQINLLGML